MRSFRLLSVAVCVAASIIGQSIEKSLDTPFGPVEVTFSPDRFDGLKATVTNRSSARIWQIRIAAEVVDEKGKVRSNGLGSEPELKAFGINPGQTSTAVGIVFDRFKLKKGADARLTLKELLLRADYRTDSPVVKTETAEYALLAALQPTGIAIQVLNRTNSTIEVIWDECSYIDWTGSATRIMHGGVKYIDRYQHQPNTTIPPGARIQDKITPAGKVSFQEGTRYASASWDTESLLPFVLPAHAARGVLDRLPGSEFGAYIRLLVDGKKTGEAVKFRVVQASVEQKLNFFLQ